MADTKTTGSIQQPEKTTRRRTSPMVQKSFPGTATDRKRRRRRRRVDPRFAWSAWSALSPGEAAAMEIPPDEWNENGFSPPKAATAGWLSNSAYGGGGLKRVGPQRRGEEAPHKPVRLGDLDEGTLRFRRHKRRSMRRKGLDDLRLRRIYEEFATKNNDGAGFDDEWGDAGGGDAAADAGLQLLDWWDLLPLKDVLNDDGDGDTSPSAGGGGEEDTGSGGGGDAGLAAAAAAGKERNERSLLWWEFLPLEELLLGASHLGTMGSSNARKGKVVVADCPSSEATAARDREEVEADEDDAGKKGRRQRLRESLLQFSSAASSSTAVAGLAASATVAAAAMAAAAVEREVAEEHGAGPKFGPRLPEGHDGRNGVTTGTDSGGGATLYEARRKGPPPPPKKPKRRVEIDPETVEGAKLVSAALVLVSNSFGLLADTVRVLGETAAGAAGSSVKLMGTAVRTAGCGLDAAGTLLEGGGANGRNSSDEGGVAAMKPPPPRTRKPLTSERLAGGKFTDHDYYHSRGGMGVPHLLENTKSVAARSVRLAGTIVRGLGESLLLAGAATESIASSTASVAEDAVRVMEDFAGSLSSAFRPHDEHRKRKKHRKPEEAARHPSLAEWRVLHEYCDPTDYLGGMSIDGDDDENSEPSFISYGSYDVDNNEEEEFNESPSVAPPPLWERVFSMEHVNAILELGSIMHAQFMACIEFTMADTQGVPSLVPELLGSMVICYVVSVLALRPTRDGRQIRSEAMTEGAASDETTSQGRKRRRIGTTDREELDRVDREPPPLEDNSDASSDMDGHHLDRECRTAQMRPLGPRDHQDFCIEYDEREQRLAGMAVRALRRCFLLVCWLLLFPFKTMYCIARRCLLVVFHQRTVLLATYIFVWAYLCRAMQMRAGSIQRNSEAAGFRAALASIGTTSPSMVESAAWLNALLDRLWRVPYDLESTEGTQPTATVPPTFVLRAAGEMKANEAARKCSCDPLSILERGGRKSCTCTSATASSLPYGGLEPYISSRVGFSLIELLESSLDSGPSDIAYVSLYSFTLGGDPPLVRGIELLGTQESGVVEYKVDLDVLLGDLSLVLDIKLSSLEYAMIPSTKLAIHSIDVRLPLELSVSATPAYPFLSRVNISLAEMPECTVRVTPSSENSGLRGVDLGSLPVLNNWIQDAIREYLSDYVTPRYISIDMGSFLGSPPSNVTSTRYLGQMAGVVDTEADTQISTPLCGLPHSTSTAAGAAAVPREKLDINPLP